jgi:hypothetical protein
VALGAAIVLAGCTTAWQEQAAYLRSIPTAMAVESTPAAAKVFLNNRYLGDTPLSVAVDCEEEIRRKTRRVSFWITQPGLALALSLLSFGLYVPFSVIPVDTETSLEPTGVYRDSPHALRIEADGHRTWTASIACGTQRPTTIRAVLEKS